MSEETQRSPLVTKEELMNLRTLTDDSQLVSLINLAAQLFPTGGDCLADAKIEEFVDILDRLLSSEKANPNLQNWCINILRKVSHANGILPRSYHLSGVELSNVNPSALGEFADTWKAKNDKGQEVCVKALRIQPQITTDFDRIKRLCCREIASWKHLSHPNVLPFLGFSETESAFWIISPWMQNGNITDYTSKNKSVNRLQLLAQAACGLAYLHSHSITHGNVNPGNILIDGDGNVHLGDFGIIGVIYPTTGKPGAHQYTAPELLDPRQPGNPTKECDVYSLAMTAYEVLTGVLPYADVNVGIVVYKVTTGQRPPRPNVQWLRDDIWNIITTCWDEKREVRFDISTVYEKLSVSSTQRDDEVCNTTAPRPATGIVGETHSSSEVGGGDTSADGSTVQKSASGRLMGVLKCLFCH